MDWGWEGREASKALTKSKKSLSPGQTVRVGHPKTVENGPTGKMKSAQGLKEEWVVRLSKEGRGDLEVGGSRPVGWPVRLVGLRRHEE